MDKEMPKSEQTPSNTPRTDAIGEKDYGKRVNHIEEHRALYDLSRTLERDLAAARSALAKAEGAKAALLRIADGSVPWSQELADKERWDELVQLLQQYARRALPEYYKVEAPSRHAATPE